MTLLSAQEREEIDELDAKAGQEPVLDPYPGEEGNSNRSDEPGSEAPEQEEADKGVEDINAAVSSMENVELEIEAEDCGSVDMKLTFEDLTIDEFTNDARDAFLSGLATELDGDFGTPPQSPPLLTA